MGLRFRHARMPVVLHVSRPMVSLCFLEKPVEFGALDGHLVHTLFTIISPTIRAHLFLLSRISYVLREESFKKLLVHQGSRSEIIEAVRHIESSIPVKAAQPV